MARVKMIDRRTGTNFWVTEERVEEYKAAGHKLAATPSAPKAKEVVEEAKEETKEEVVEEIAKEVPKPKKKPVNRAKKR